LGRWRGEGLKCREGGGEEGIQMFGMLGIGGGKGGGREEKDQYV
tara:strand:+ start:21599 stop:21730 length:132 start_codon:yes stop_codon:yes gene_type:complete